MRGGWIEIALKVSHHWPTSELPFKWPFPGGPIEYWLGSFVIFHAFRTSFAKKTHIFVIFQGGGGPDHVSPLDSRMISIKGY